MAVEIECHPDVAWPRRSGHHLWMAARAEPKRGDSGRCQVPEDFSWFAGTCVV